MKNRFFDKFFVIIVKSIFLDYEKIFKKENEFILYPRLSETYFHTIYSCVGVIREMIMIFVKDFTGNNANNLFPWNQSK